MPECRYTLLRSGRAELEEKKSRFLAQSFFVRSEAEVAEILAAVRKEHYDARHVCSAYVLFGNPPLEKSSDDGEPAKTAGLPWSSSPYTITQLTYNIHYVFTNIYYIHFCCIIAYCSSALSPFLCSTKACCGAIFISAAIRSKL